MQERQPDSVDEARILPRLRAASPLLERRRLERQQAAALQQELDQEPTGKPFPATARHEQTKPGDPQQLRGIPAIGRSVAGASPGTNPEAAAIRNESRAA